MALINCKECNAKISDSAKSCPNCGNPNLKQQTSSKFALILFGIIVTIFILFIMFEGNNMSHENIEVETEVDTSTVAHTPQLSADERKGNIEKLRNMFLDSGIDVKVSVYGKNNETLELRNVAFDDVWFRKFETAGMFDNFHNLGFTQIILNNEYDYRKTISY